MKIYDNDVINPNENCSVFLNTDDVNPKDGLRNGFTQTPMKKMSSFKGSSSSSSPKGKHLAVPKVVPGVGVVTGGQGSRCQFHHLFTISLWTSVL